MPLLFPQSLKRKSSKLSLLLFKRDRAGSKDSKESDISDVSAWVDSNNRKASSEQHKSLSRIPSHKSLSRTGSKLHLFLFGTKEIKLPVVQYHDAMIRLETVVQSDRGRQELIQKLITLRGDYSIQVRFCAVVDTFDAAQKEDDRRLLANKIIDTFLQTGSMFQISINETRKKSIIEGNYNQLLDAKRELLDEMSRNSEIMEIIDYVETLEL